MAAKVRSVWYSYCRHALTYRTGRQFYYISYTPSGLRPMADKSRHRSSEVPWYRFVGIVLWILWRPISSTISCIKSLLILPIANCRIRHSTVFRVRPGLIDLELGFVNEECKTTNTRSVPWLSSIIPFAGSGLLGYTMGFPLKRVSKWLCA